MRLSARPEFNSQKLEVRGKTGNAYKAKNLHNRVVAGFHVCPRTEIRTQINRCQRQYGRFSAKVWLHSESNLRSRRDGFPRPPEQSAARNQLTAAENLSNPVGRGGFLSPVRENAAQRQKSAGILRIFAPTSQLPKNTIKKSKNPLQIRRTNLQRVILRPVPVPRSRTVLWRSRAKY